MSIRHPLRTLSAAALVTIGLVAVPAISASAAPTASAAPARVEQQKPPKYTAYEYRGTFSVELDHHVELEYYDERDGKVIDASASLTGRIPSFIITKVGDRFQVSVDTLASTVKAVSGSVDSTTTTDEGRHEVRCQGDSIWKTNKQHPFVLADAKGTKWLRAFALLSLPQTCRDNQGGEPTTSVHSFPELPARLKSNDRFGSKHITFPLRAERNYPRVAGQTKDCPDSVETLTKACTYELTGSLELTRVRAYRPVAQQPVPRVDPTYVYDATFKADVTHHLQLQYYDERDGKVLDASASVSGRIPRLRVTKDGSPEGDLVMDASKSRVTANTGTVDSTTTTNEGDTEVRCTGSTIWKTDKQHPYLTVTTTLDPVFYPFATLSLPQTCRDNQGGEPTTNVHSLPGLNTRLHRSTGQIGDKRIVYTFVAEQSFPRAAGDDEKCLGEVGSLTTGCTYKVKGRMILTRVKRLR